MGHAETTIAGIDYGAKLAGTTVFCFNNAGYLHFHASQKGKDADEFLKAEISNLHPILIGLDAPLSLPGVYHALPACSNYHFRQGDLEAGAMSPMFLGGLTARAMALKATHGSPHRVFIEVYPRLVFEKLQLEDLRKNWKDSRDALIQAISAYTGMEINASDLISAHHCDAMAAFVAAWDYQRGMAKSYGRQDEGLIWF